MQKGEREENWRIAKFLSFFTGSLWNVDVTEEFPAILFGVHAFCRKVSLLWRQKEEEFWSGIFCALLPLQNIVSFFCDCSRTIRISDITCARLAGSGFNEVFLLRSWRFGAPGILLLFHVFGEAFFRRSMFFFFLIVWTVQLTVWFSERHNSTQK